MMPESTATGYQLHADRHQRREQPAQDRALDISSTEAIELLARWASLQAVRRLTSVVAFLVFLIALRSS